MVKGGAPNKYEGNLHRRFVVRVLIPPFVALLLLSVMGLWQLDRVLRHQAVDNMWQSAGAAAAALTREFEMRETVAKSTGSELLIIKSEYKASRQKLDENYAACQKYRQGSRSFNNSPGGVCEPFLAGLANANANLAALDAEYVKAGQTLAQAESQRINERLSAFKQFFPETLALVVMDGQKQIVSSALSGAFKGSVETFQPDAQAALDQPIYGKQTTVEGFKLSVFAFPISDGSVLAAYDINNSQYIPRVWAHAPINRSAEIAVILDANGKLAYPNLKKLNAFESHSSQLKAQPSTGLALDGIHYTAVASAAENSNWLVAVASPTAVVLSASRDAQLWGIIAIGLFIVGFTWVGSFFVQRTLRNIVTLVGGAMVFGSGRLDYKITLDHADREFARLGDTMNSMAQRISGAEQAIDEKNKEFISVATHELRAPLTAILGHLSLLHEMYGQQLDQKANSLVNQVSNSATQLRDLVNDMLNVARLESGLSELSLSSLPIKKLVQEVVDTMQVVAKANHVHLTYLDTHAEYVMADEAKTRIVINNYVSNGIKYNRPGGSLTISHERRGGQLVTLVADTGLGIPEEGKAHIFEKFFRVKTDDRKYITGTGLGMYIVKEYVEQMHGKVWYESTLGKGTTFYFSLPIGKAPLRARAASRIKKLAKHKLLHRRRPKTKQR